MRTCCKFNRAAFSTPHRTESSRTILYYRLYILVSYIMCAYRPFETNEYIVVEMGAELASGSDGSGGGGVSPGGGANGAAPASRWSYWCCRSNLSGFQLSWFDESSNQMRIWFDDSCKSMIKQRPDSRIKRVTLLHHFLARQQERAAAPCRLQSLDLDVRNIQSPLGKFISRFSVQNILRVV